MASLLLDELITQLQNMIKELEENFVQNEMKKEYTVIQKGLENKRSFLKGYKPMGSLMSPELESQSYYLGFFMYQGEVTFDKKTFQKLGKPPKKSLEDYMNHNPTSVSFLDFSRKSPNEENKWIFRNTVILESGMMQTMIVPKKQLDGIFFIKEVSPPNYL